MKRLHENGGRCQLTRRCALVALSLALIPLELGAAQSDTIRDEEAIRQHRMGTLVVQAAPNATVKIEQVRHAFWFGAALANQAFDGRMSPENTAQYRKVFLENFNSAVTENALKWLSMQPHRGPVNYAVVDA
ncbi:MAG TPA: endo-1,4-beta-xylanase, partial [Opitutus sp.]|nr:endo-1,4-beta-xylanase [Opitutus sp.]